MKIRDFQPSCNFTAIEIYRGFQPLSGRSSDARLNQQTRTPPDSASHPGALSFDGLQPLKLWFGWPSSSRSPIRFTASLRIEAAANTITPTVGSTNGMTLSADTRPATLPTKLRYLSAFMVTGERCQRRRPRRTLAAVRISAPECFDALPKQSHSHPERIDSEPVGLSSATPKALMDEMRGEVPFRVRFAPCSTTRRVTPPKSDRSFNNNLLLKNRSKPCHP